MTVAPAWIEAHCVVPDGFRLGAPFRLYGYQLRFFSKFYLVRGTAKWVPEAPVRAPAFRYRRGLLVGPQKLGKGPHTAAHVCLEGVGPALFAGWAGEDDGYACADHGCPCGWEYPYEPGEPMGMPWPTPLIQITAYSEDQTDNIYDALRPMIEHGPLDDLITHTGEEFIRLPGGGRIDTVTSNAQSRLGQRVTFVPQDEVGIWTKTSGMTKVADTQYRGLAGMGGRASLTTNAWDPAEHSVAQTQWDSTARDIWRQMDVPPPGLSFKVKAHRRKILQAVYPPDTLTRNGGHIDLAAIEAEANDLADRDLPQAARFFGNMFETSAGRAVDPAAWRQLARPERGKPPKGTPIGIGFDGSEVSDSTVLRGCTRDGYSFLIGIWECPFDPVTQKPSTSWRVPRAEVHARVAWAFKQYRVGRMLCDPPRWESEIEAWASKYNREGEDDLVQKYATFSDQRIGRLMDRWMTAIAEGTHTHDGDPDTTAHVENTNKAKLRTRIEQDPDRVLYRPVKASGLVHIDASVSDMLALEAAMTMPEPPSKPATAPAAPPTSAGSDRDLWRPDRLNI